MNQGDNGQVTRLSPSSFEENLRRLEDIVAKLQEGHLPLDRAMELYQDGVRLVGESRSLLETSRTRVEKLNKLTGELEPLEPTEDADSDEK